MTKEQMKLFGIVRPEFLFGSILLIERGDLPPLYSRVEGIECEKDHLIIQLSKREACISSRRRFEILYLEINPQGKAILWLNIPDELPSRTKVEAMQRVKRITPLKI